MNKPTLIEKPSVTLYSEATRITLLFFIYKKT